MITVKKYNIKELVIIILPLVVFSNFFNYRELVLNPMATYAIAFIELIFFVLCLPCTMKFKDNLSVCVRNILFLFVGSIFVGMIVSGQSITSGLTFTCRVLTFCVYFWLMKFRVSSRSVVQVIWIMVVLYTICWISSLLTYPNHSFGYFNNWEAYGEGGLEQRGIIRLDVPGVELLACVIFYSLYMRSINKKYIFLLIILFIILLLQGARTPFFVTFILCALYLVWHSKLRKTIIISGTILILLMNSFLINLIIDSKSDNILIRYLQLTYEQIFESDEEDVRIKMSEYYFFDYNDNIIQVFLGNGIPTSDSDYGRSIENNKTFKKYFLSDVSYPLIYIYYGLLGLILYTNLLYTVIKMKVTPQYEFSKLFAFFFFLVSFAGRYIVFNSMFMALGLYLMSMNRGKSMVRENYK